MPAFSDILYWLIIAGVLVGESLLILWSATSTRPRLVRALVVWVTIVMLMTIDAKGPALVFTVTAAMTWAIIAGVQRLTGEKQHGWHFQVGDLLIVLMTIGTIIALLRDSSSAWSLRTLLYVPLMGLPLAPVIAFAYLAVTNPTRPQMIGASILSVAVSALGLMLWRIEHLLPIRLPVHLTQPERYSAAIHMLWLISLVVCVFTAVWGARQLRTRQPGATRRTRLGYGFLVAISSGIAFLLIARYSDHLWIAGKEDLGRELLFVTFLFVPVVALALIVATVTWLTRENGSATNFVHRRLFGRIAAGSAVLAVLPLAWLYWQMLWPTPFPPPPPGEPNHYGQIVAICKELTETYQQWEQEDPTAARNFDAAKRPKIFESRVEEMLPLLAAPNYVPTETLESIGIRPVDVEATIDFGDQILLSRCLAALANKGRTQGKLDAEVDYAVAYLRFVAMRHRGGTTIGSLHEGGNGTELLAASRNRAPLSKTKEVIEILDRTLAERESLDVLLARAQVQQQRQRNWQGRLDSVLMRFGDRRDVPPGAKEAYLRSELALRSIQILYAIRLVQKEQGRLPKDLAELSPEFLPSVPLDPYMQKPFHYRPEVTSYKLYSVGPNSTDDGGLGDDIDLSQAEYQ